MIDSLPSWVAAFASLAGAFFFFASSVGLWRLPDFYARMHAPTKAATLGLMLLAVGSLLHNWEGHWTNHVEDVLLIVFVLLTIPVSSQLLVRAANCQNTPYDERTGGEPPPCPVVAQDSVGEPGEPSDQPADGIRTTNTSLDSKSG